MLLENCTQLTVLWATSLVTWIQKIQSGSRCGTLPRKKNLSDFGNSKLWNVQKIDTFKYWTGTEDKLEFEVLKATSENYENTRL